MRAEPSKPGTNAQRGVSLLELLVVVFVTLVLAALASPNIMQAVYNLRLVGTAADLAGLMQQARIMASKNNASNPNYSIRYVTQNGKQVAFIDLNNNGVWDASVSINGVATPEPKVIFSGTVFPAAGAPSGSGGQPGPYVLSGDSSSGTVNTNANILGFSSRGLPCNYDAPPTCSTPSASYFVYYLTDTRMGAPGWAGVVVTKAGRTKVVTWNGTAWQ
jgi:prepilin-type N-terminal cleavage/methylation domain-containing protein